MIKLKLHTLTSLLIKLVFAVAIVWMCLSPFLPDGKFSQLKMEDLIRPSEISGHLIFPILIFTFINLFIETIKWKLAASECEKISFRKAWYGVFAGIAVSNIFPWKTGDFLGKISFLKAESKIRGAYLSVYASMTQFLITLVLGFLSLNLFYAGLNLEEVMNLSEKNNSIITFSVLSLLALILFIFILRNSVWKLLTKIAGPRTLYYLRKGRMIPLSLTFRLLGLSVVRYASFVLPYVFLIYWYEPTVSIPLLIGGLCIVFFMQSFVPGFLISDLPVKGMMHLLILATMVSETYIIGNAVLLVFLCNQIIPSAIGAIILIFAHPKEPKAS